MELKGKNVFITGSTRGIGLAMAHKFASLGANIILNGRREIGEELISEFSDYGVQVIPISGDVSDSTDAKRMVEEAIEKALAIDPNPYVIGGGEIYAQALPFADVIELTRVDHIFPEADVFFPEFNTEEWELVSSEPFEKDEKHAYNFTFEKYLKR